MHCPPKKKLLLDSRKGLTDCSHPQGWIVCRAIELNLAESLITAAQEHHDGNHRQSVPKMSDKLASLLPRRPMPDHHHSNQCIRESKISCSLRTEDRNYWMPN